MRTVLKMRRSRTRLHTSWFPALLALWLLLPAAWAHHSDAAYDTNITLTVSGVIKDFDWSAPHSAVTLAYQDAKGQKELFVSTSSPAVIVGQGFSPRDFPVGAKVLVSYHPLRSGMPGGELVEMKFGDGRVFFGAGRPQEEKRSGYR
jgi:hypothetical protein